jgi:hypothetical protein
MSDGPISNQQEALALLAIREWVAIDWLDDALVRSLLNRGLVARQMNPNGRRQSGVVLTDAGRAVVYG